MKNTKTSPTSTQILMPAIVVLGSFLFSSKGIVVKMMYAENLSPGGVLALRMSVALPFYLVATYFMRRSLSGISLKDWIAISGLALIGYFLCSLVNVMGLQYISVGLERVVLFCYPSLVLLGSAILQKRRPSGTLAMACLLSWIGLYLVIQEEINLNDHASRILAGSALVLLSAIIYACYILVSKPLIMRVGSQSYTSVVMCISCVFVLIYFGITDGDLTSLTSSKNAVIYGVIIGTFGTVIPTYILSYGLSKIPATSYAVLSSAGPVGTIILSLAMAGHLPSWVQCTGVVFSISGCLLASRPR